MQSALPLDVLADELGAAAGRIERELRLKDEARAARFEARLAAIELAAFKAEEERQRIFGERLSELRNGRDGEPGKDGKDGKDADISDLVEKVQEVVDLSAIHLGQLNRELTEKVNQKIAEVKDGEPGKDADIEPVLELVDGIERKHRSFLESLEIDLSTRVEAKLAEVRDGKDGEPGRDGKDADIGPIREEFSGLESHLRLNLEASLGDALDRINAKLAEVKDGKDGEQGPPGRDGKDGKLPIAREWTNRVHYEGDVVRHNGATYQALADTGQQPPHSDWGELASRGTDGTGFVLRGTYDTAAEYKQHDIVMINRNSFAAKCDNPGECPGDGWQLFGPSGQRGKEGPPGAKGADGRSVSIAGLEADPDAMILRITDSLGKTFELDLEPIAERIIEAAR
jgi:hypothetical protein